MASATMFKYLKIALFSLAFIALAACKKDKKTSVQNVNNNCVYSNAMQQQVNYTILSGSAQFFPLNVIGGYTYVAGYGLKGILVYRINTNQFVALERSCTHDGCDNANAFVKVLTGNTSVKDSICGSIFNITDGTIQNGPATVGLFQYHTSWDGNQLLIYN